MLREDPRIPLEYEKVLLSHGHRPIFVPSKTENPGDERHEHLGTGMVRWHLYWGSSITWYFPFYVDGWGPAALFSPMEKGILESAKLDGWPAPKGFRYSEDYKSLGMLSPEAEENRSADWWDETEG